MVELLTVRRLSEPVLLPTRRLFVCPPAMTELSIEAVPVRFVKRTLSSPAPNVSMSAAELVPLLPLTVEYSSAKPETVLPRMPAFGLSLIRMRRSVTFVAVSM